MESIMQLRETIDDEEKVGVENNEWARWHKGKGGVRAWPGSPYSCSGTIPQKEVLLYTYTMTADCTDHTSTTMTTNATATINTLAATRCPLLQPLHYYRSRCYGMTGVSPHSDTFFLHQLPDPGWSPGRQAGYPGAGREGYWATHQKKMELAAGMVVSRAWRETIKQLRLIHYRIRDSSRASRGPPPTWLDESERLQASAIDI